jgi:hypothetical protein
MSSVSWWWGVLLVACRTDEAPPPDRDEPRDQTGREPTEPTEPTDDEPTDDEPHSGLQGPSADTGDTAGTGGPLAPIWAAQLGTTGWDFATAVAVDAADDIVIVGSTDSALPGQVSAGSTDGFVQKYAPDGTLQWTRQFGGPSFDGLASVAVDAADRIVVGGSTYGLSGTPLVGVIDLLVRVYDPNGDEVWTRTLGATGDILELSDVAVDADGSVIVLGNARRGTLDSGIVGLNEAVVWKIAPDGSTTWTRRVTAPPPLDNFSLLAPGGLALSSAGELFLTGTVTALPGQAQNAFLTKLDPDGDEVWSVPFGAPGGPRPNEFLGGASVALDAAGQVIVAGWAWPNVALAGQVSSGGTDAFVQAFDAAGRATWNDQLGSGQYAGAASILPIPGGGYVLAGGVRGALAGTSYGEVDTYLRTYDGAGTPLVTTQFGASGACVPCNKTDAAAAALLSTGAIVTVGSVLGTFPGEVAVDPTGYDAFVVVFPPGLE